jgi:predicted DNA-binding protein YlxM (UPF0122 family)
MDRDALIVSAYTQEDLTIPQIMVKFNICRRTVYAVLKSGGVRLERNQRFTDEEIDNVCRLYAQRKKAKNVADATGYTKQRVSYILKRHYKAWSKLNRPEHVRDVPSLLAQVRAKKSLE